MTSTMQIQTAREVLNNVTSVICPDFTDIIAVPYGAPINWVDLGVQFQCADCGGFLTNQPVLRLDTVVVRQCAKCGAFCEHPAEYEDE